MRDPIETAAARMAALERENAVIRANNDRLQAEANRLRELSSGERSELHGLRALVAEINEALNLEGEAARHTLEWVRKISDERDELQALVAEINGGLGLNPAEPADARTTLDAVRTNIECLDETSDKLARARGQSGAPVSDTAQKLAEPEPPPRAGHTAVLPVALAFLQERAAQGRAKYGRDLEAGNGRDADVDALQEAGDFFLYQVQRHIERQHEERELARLTTLRSREEWTAADGVVLWWVTGELVFGRGVGFPVTGRDDSTLADVYTHWTPLPTVRP